MFWEKAQEQIELTDSLIKESSVIILAVIGIDRPKSQYEAIDALCSRIRKDQSIIIVNSYPTLLKNPLKINGGITKQSNIAIERENNNISTEIFKNLKLKYNNVYVYNLDDEFINNNLGCINDTVCYYDKRHINLFGAQKLALEHDKVLGNLIKLLINEQKENNPQGSR